MTMKYKVGDKVRIKTWESMEKEYEVIESLDKSFSWIKIGITNFIYDMESLLMSLNKDRVVTIKKIVNNRHYFIKEIKYNWVDEMMEDYKEPIYKPIYTRWELLDIR